MVVGAAVWTGETAGTTVRVLLDAVESLDGDLVAAVEAGWSSAEE